VALEGASFVNGFNRGTARKVAAALPNPAHTLDEQASRLVAIKEGIAAIVTGSLNRHGSGYNLSVKAIDAVTGKTLTSADVNTATKDALLLEVPKLAVPIRQALGDTTPKSVQLNAAQGTFSTGNLEAVHQYSVGMEQQFQGSGPMRCSPSRKRRNWIRTSPAPMQEWPPLLEILVNWGTQRSMQSWRCSI